VVAAQRRPPVCDGYDFDPERVSEIWHPFQGASERILLSGGLRYAATTGYFLTALQAGTRSLPHPGSVFIDPRQSILPSAAGGFSIATQIRVSYRPLYSTRGSLV
jgi:hypothetical protein